MKTYLCTSNGMGLVNSVWVKGARSANNPKVKELIKQGWTFTSAEYDRDNRTWSAVVELWEKI